MAAYVQRLQNESNTSTFICVPKKLSTLEITRFFVLVKVLNEKVMTALLKNSEFGANRVFIYWRNLKTRRWEHQHNINRRLVDC